MWSDFKEFAIKGNVVDLAVAVVIGAAFGQMITSLVNDIITPIIGIIIGGIDFRRIIWHVDDANLLVGNFIQSVFDFTIVAFSIFMVVRIMMKIQNTKGEVIVEEEPSIDMKEALLIEIRDILKKDAKK